MFGSSQTLFFLISLMLALAPGPDLLYIITKGSSQGILAGVVSALGVHTGVLVHIIISCLGFSALIASSPIIFSVIKYAGAIYLGYLGLKTLYPEASACHEVNIHCSKQTLRHSLGKVYIQGIMTDVLNPKVILLFLAFFPQFIDLTSQSAHIDILYLGLLFIAIALPVNILVGLIAAVVGQYMSLHSNHSQLGKWMSATAFIILSIGCAFTSPLPM